MTRIVSIPALALRVEGAPDDISAIYMAINQLFGFASQVATVQPALALETATEANEPQPAEAAALAAA